MVTRITVTLEQPEYSALLDMAVEELRNPQHQLRYILRQELERRGKLPLSEAGGAARAQQQNQGVHRETDQT